MHMSVKGARTKTSGKLTIHTAGCGGKCTVAHVTQTERPSNNASVRSIDAIAGCWI